MQRPSLKGKQSIFAMEIMLNGSSHCENQLLQAIIPRCGHCCKRVLSQEVPHDVEDSLDSISLIIVERRMKCNISKLKVSTSSKWAKWFILRRELKVFLECIIPIIFKGVKFRWFARMWVKINTNCVNLKLFRRLKGI